MKKECYVCQGANKCPHGGEMDLGTKKVWICNECLKNGTIP